MGKKKNADRNGARSGAVDSNTGRPYSSGAQGNPPSEGQALIPLAYGFGPQYLQYYYPLVFPQVDMWRSYRQDTTNLQSLSNFGQPTVLDATAPVFVPAALHTSQNAPFTQSQSLRNPNRVNERTSGQQARKYATLQPFAADTYASGRGQTNNQDEQSDHVLPSIEQYGNFADSALGNRGSSLQMAQGRSSSSVPYALRSRSQRLHSPTPPPVPVPVPTAPYLKQAKLEPTPLANPQKLLVVLDLNGTLLHRKNRAKNPTNFQMRPGVTTLLRYLFDHHVVMIYTSARPENATAMINKLMHPDQRNQLAAIWARDKLDLTKAQYAGKVQVYKKLQKIWGDTAIQATAGEGRRWNQTNTILVDDSHLKALAQPHNLLQVPEFINDKPNEGMEAMNEWSAQQQDVLKQLEMKLEELKMTADVSRMIRLWQQHEKPIPVVDGQVNSVDEAVDQHALLREQGKMGTAAVNEQLLTPKSPPADSSSEDGEALDKDSHPYRDDASHSRTGAAASKSPIDEARSVSPVNEAVFRDILGMDKEEETNTGS